MSFKNPTPIRLGMSGILNGTRYLVVGRVVLGEKEAGEVYYWNEYHLENERGEMATLVYEDTDHGAEWRLFHLFEPTRPLTAAEAATKHLGDPIELDETRRFIRFESTSRVYHIEGTAPDGVEVGVLAHYFNAPSGNTMVVVSWTGEEVEFYRGVDLSALMVSRAFNVRLLDLRRLFRAPAWGRSFSEAWGGDLSGLWVALAAFVALVVFLLATNVGFSSGRRASAVVRTTAPRSALAVGKMGTLRGTRFWVQSHLLVEIAEVGQRFERHEYLLSDEQGSRALLVRGSKPGAGDWWLFKPLQPLTPLTPQQAATIRWGQTVEIDAVIAKVSDLFQATIKQLECAEAADVATGDCFFGFGGPAQRDWLLVRWNANYINFFQGQAVPEKEVLAAFAR